MSLHSLISIPYVKGDVAPGSKYVVERTCRGLHPGLCVTRDAGILRGAMPSLVSLSKRLHDQAVEGCFYAMAFHDHGGALCHQLPRRFFFLAHKRLARPRLCILAACVCHQRQDGRSMLSLSMEDGQFHFFLPSQLIGDVFRQHAEVRSARMCQLHVTNCQASAAVVIDAEGDWHEAFGPDASYPQADAEGPGDMEAPAASLDDIMAAGFESLMSAGAKRARVAAKPAKVIDGKPKPEAFFEEDIAAYPQSDTDGDDERDILDELERDSVQARQQPEAESCEGGGAEAPGAAAAAPAPAQQPAAGASSSFEQGVGAVPPPPLPPEDGARAPRSRAHREAVVPRGARQESWGPFSLARIFTNTSAGQVHGGWVATCRRHHNADDMDGRLCRKSLWMGATLTSAECKLRVKLWLLEGARIGDGPTSRTDHLNINPRHLELKPADEVEAMVQGMGHGPTGSSS